MNTPVAPPDRPGGPRNACPRLQRLVPEATS